MNKKRKNEIDTRIHVFMQMLSSINTASLTIYTPDFEVVSSTSEHVDVMSIFFALGVDRKLYDKTSVNDLEVMTQLRTHFAPNIFTNSLGMVWISDVWIEEEEVKQIYLLGPVFLDDISVQYVEKQLEKYKLSVQLKHSIMKFILEMPIVSLNRMYEYGIMLHSCITNKKIAVSDYWYPKLKETEEKESILKPKHGTYIAEQKLLNLVEEGNLEYKKVLDSYISIGELGDYSTGEYLRQEKNTIIIFITLCSRAAIRGGVSSEIAYTLSEKYIKRVEEANDLSSLTILNREMIDDFVIRVHRKKYASEQISPRIQKTCDYIGLNIEKKIDIHQLANMAGYSDYYYSSRFRKEVGKTVKDYVMECKLEKAKGLLSETTMTVQEISELLGFGTQSYFGESFRKLNKLTPTEFREINKK